MKRSGAAQCKLKWDTVTTCNYNHTYWQIICNVRIGIRTIPLKPLSGCTRAQSLRNLALVLYTCIWLLYPAPTSVQDGLDPHQLALVVFFLLSNSVITSLHLQCAFPASCTGGVFPLPTRHLLMCTHKNDHILQLALCGDNAYVRFTSRNHWSAHTVNFQVPVDLGCCSSSTYM